MPIAAILAVTGCGGGERQDADEKSGTYTVTVVNAKFPIDQVIAKQAEFSVGVRNDSSGPLPNVAVTVETLDDSSKGGYAAFGKRSKEPGLGDPERPVWVLDSGPKGGITAYTNTWALGRLGAGETKTFTWRVTAVRPGTHTVQYRVAAGLDGKARAVANTDGDESEVRGSFTVNISGKPAQATVDPDTGKVVRESDEDK